MKDRDSGIEEEGGKQLARVAEQAALTPSPISHDLLAGMTAARVALGRAGSSLPTRAHLSFVADHARARDAVWTAVDFDALAGNLEALGLATVRLRSEAADRVGYLRRPDLGRRLDAASVLRMAAASASPQSRIALVIAVLSACLVEQGRVAIGDPIGDALGSELVIVLIGERPGLSAADSLGCYLTWQPRVGTPDSRRNCISNIRAGGLSAIDAAARIARLAAEALRRRTSGIALKEEDTDAMLPEAWK